MKMKSNLLALLALLAVAAVCSLLQNAHAAGGKPATSTDTPTAPSNKPAAGGGGGGKSTTPAPAPAPAPALSAGPITFSSSGSVSGTCTGDYRIGAYYPTLLDMTVNVYVSSLNVPDGTVLYVRAVGTPGTFYTYTVNTMTVIGGAATCTEKIFVGVGVGLAGVTISDASGNILFAGN